MLNEAAVAATEHGDWMWLKVEAWRRPLAEASPLGLRLSTDSRSSQEGVSCGRRADAVPRLCREAEPAAPKGRRRPGVGGMSRPEKAVSVGKPRWVKKAGGDGGGGGAAARRGVTSGTRCQPPGSACGGGSKGGSVNNGGSGRNGSTIKPQTNPKTLKPAAGAARGAASTMGAAVAASATLVGYMVVVQGINKFHGGFSSGGGSSSSSSPRGGQGSVPITLKPDARPHLAQGLHHAQRLVVALAIRQAGCAAEAALR